MKKFPMYSETDGAKLVIPAGIITHPTTKIAFGFKFSQGI